jgi:transcription antitermination factor NusG
LISFAIRVPPGKEQIAERILRNTFREREIPGVEFRVPINHVVRKQASTAGRRVVRSRPFLPGIVLVCVEPLRPVPFAELAMFSFVLGFVMGDGSRPLMLREPDMIRILGELHQRPSKYSHIPGRRKRQPGSSMAIEDGPYAGRIARVISQGATVTSMTITGTCPWYDDLQLDDGHNQSYKPRPDVPLAVAAREGKSSKGGPAARGSDRAHCVPSSRPRKRA